MTKITNEILHERIVTIFNVMNEVKSAVKETNGKVATAYININELRTRQEDCPARNNYMSDKKIRRDWAKYIPSFTLSVIALLIALMK